MCEKPEQTSQEHKPLQVLFVDDERLILEGLEGSLRRQRHHWEMRFVMSGAQALKCLAKWPCDVLVTDLQMPEMSGLELLAAVKERHPRTARIALSAVDGFGGNETLTNVHAYLNKPCPTHVLVETVEQVAHKMEELP